MLWISFLQKQALWGSLTGIYPSSFNNIRFAEEDWESDREVIVIAAGEGAESLLQQAGFPIMEALPSHQFFSLPHESLSSHYSYLKRDTKWINSQRDVQKIFCLWSVFLWEFAIQKLLISSLQQNFQGNVTNLLNKSKWKTLAGPRKSLGLVSRAKTHFFFGFLMPLRQLNGLQLH